MKDPTGRVALYWTETLFSLRSTPTKHCLSLCVCVCVQMCLPETAPLTHCPSPVLEGTLKPLTGITLPQHVGCFQRGLKGLHFIIERPGADLAKIRPRLSALTLQPHSSVFSAAQQPSGFSLVTSATYLNWFLPAGLCSNACDHLVVTND